MAAAKSSPEQDMTSKFVEMTNDFRTKAGGLMGDITSAFGVNLQNAIKNYTEMQASYVTGFTGIANGASKANAQLIESMDKNFAELKGNIDTLYKDTQTKADQAIDTGATNFRTQCEDVIKKFPMIPETAYKDTLKSIVEGKGKVTGSLEKQYKEVIAKLENNYKATRKELSLAEFKQPKIPSLDIQSNLLTSAKDVTSNMMKSVMNTVQPAVKNLADQMPGPSKNSKK